MTRSSKWSLDTASVPSLGWLAVILVLLTGVFHIYSGIVEGRIPVLVAGIGFLGAIVLYLVNFRRRLLYVVGVLYTAVQFPLWYVAKAGEYTTVGYVDKAVQALLIVLLVYLFWRSRSANRGSSTQAL